MLARAHAMMERQLTQMVRLVDDLLDVNRVSRGKIELRRETIDLAEALESALETSRPNIEAAHHEMLVLRPPEPIFVDADLTRLSQVFGNLLNNAAKYTDPGGRIQITMDSQGGDAVVRVRDSGVGIPEDRLPTVFDMFTQIDRSFDRSRGGLGVGLSLVKRIVEMHGGSVAVHSPPLPRPDDDSWPRGKGSEFIVRLPAVAAPAERAAVALPPPSAPSASRLRVLIADDNVDAAESLAELLSDLGNETRVVHDGVEALRGKRAPFTRTCSSSISGCPHLDGYEVGRKVREEPWGRRALMVAVTGWGQPEDRRRSAEAGFDRHLVEPIEIDEIQKVLAEARSV